MHVHCPGPCCINKSILHVYVHVACSCQWCIPCQCFMSMSMPIDIYIEMPECRTVRHPVSLVPDWKNLTMPKPVRYWTKLTQSSIFLVRYRTKIRDAGMPMPALVCSMPMPSYGNCRFYIYSTVSVAWRKFTSKAHQKIILRPGVALHMYMKLWLFNLQFKFHSVFTSCE